METTTEKAVSVWKNRNFLRLWTSDTISQFGTQFSGLAIPFTFILLSKNAFLFGLLQAVGGLAFPLFALFIGVYVDRHYRKRIMTLANVGRGLALGSVPLVAIAGFLPSLGISLLFAVSFVVGLLTVFFDVSYQAILPSLVGRQQLVQGNSMLEFSRSSAAVVGPAMAGVVVQAVYPPLTLAIDASAYLASAGVLSTIQTEEALQDSKKTVWHDLKEGLAVVLKDNRLRMIAGSTATFNLFGSALFPVAFLYLTGPLGLTAGVYGFIFTVGAVGLLVGVFLSGMIVRKIGLGWAIVASMLIGGLGLIPYVVVNPGLTSPALAVLGPIPWSHDRRNPGNTSWSEACDGNQRHRCHLRLPLGHVLTGPFPQSDSRTQGIDHILVEAPSPAIMAKILLSRVEKVATETLIHRLSSNQARKAFPRALRRRESRVAMF